MRKTGLRETFSTELLEFLKNSFKKKNTMKELEVAEVST